MIFCFLFDSIISKFKTSKVKLFNIIPKTLIMPGNRTSINSRKKLSVLITGGTGLVGKYLTSALIEAGYNVSHLSRGVDTPGNIRVFRWDPERGLIDRKALDGIDYIIHLAGANIGEKRWTNKRKLEIIRSRVDSAKLLHKTISQNGISLKAFISASATGIYGAETSAQVYVENDPPAHDFLGSVCRQWEAAADLFQNSGIRTVKIRTAIVLEKNDSALSKLMKPANFGFLVKTGGGFQYMPWIHINDLCSIYLKAIEDSEIKGPFNAVAPQHVTHNDFMKTLGRVIKRPVLSVPVPGFILKLILGEMSEVILTGSRVSSDKIINSGFRFRYILLEEALTNVLVK
jgi:hypothetical protein